MGGRGQGREPISPVGGWENRTQALGRWHCTQSEPHIHNQGHHGIILDGDLALTTSKVLQALGVQKGTPGPRTQAKDK